MEWTARFQKKKKRNREKPKCQRGKKRFYFWLVLRINGVFFGEALFQNETPQKLQVILLEYQLTKLTFFDQNFYKYRRIHSTESKRPIEFIRQEFHKYRRIHSTGDPQVPSNSFDGYCFFNSNPLICFFTEPSWPPGSFGANLSPLPWKLIK